MGEKLNIKINDLRENEPVLVEHKEKKFVLILHNGKVNALNEECTHEKGPLEQGYIDGDELICPWHSGAFNVETGKANENTTWVTDTKHYSIKEIDGELYIEL